MISIAVRRNARALFCVAVLVGLASYVQAQPYQQTNLVSDGTIPAAHTDPNLQNAWGIAASAGSPMWVANNHTGTATLYDGNGIAQSLVVSIPPPAAGSGSGSPTGMVFYGGSAFTVSNGAASGPSRFIFATEDGIITGWNSAVPPPPTSTHAQLAVDNSASGAIYKGLAIAPGVAGGRLYATDFHNGKVDVFNSSFQPLNLAGAFLDPNLPAGYAPFGIQSIGSSVFVTYALQDANAEDDVPGGGHGYIDVYDTDGLLQSRLVSNGALNSPWGMAVAPSNFEPFSNDLLVGNFGNGRINAFDPTTGALQGTLSDINGPLSIDGLWGMAFGNGANAQPTSTLFFAAGPNGEANGLYGRIDLVPDPATLLLLLAGAGIYGRRGRRLTRVRA